MKRQGPYDVRTRTFVALNPGCTKYDLAAHLTWHPRRDPSKQYYLVNSAIRRGVIRCEVSRSHAGRYALYVA